MIIPFLEFKGGFNSPLGPLFLDREGEFYYLSLIIILSIAHTVSRYELAPYPQKLLILKKYITITGKLNAR